MSPIDVGGGQAPQVQGWWVAAEMGEAEQLVEQLHVVESAGAGELPEGLPSRPIPEKAEVLVERPVSLGRVVAGDRQRAVDVQEFAEMLGPDDAPNVPRAGSG